MESTGNNLVGQEVCRISPSEANPRNTEGTFIRRNDGAILFAWSYYCSSGTEAHLDHADARLEVIASRDEGLTWGEQRTLLTKPEPTDANIMSPSFLRMANGDMGLFYLRKFGGRFCVPYLVRSSDEGESWSEPLCCVEEPGYYVMNNDRVLRTRTGRIFLPLADTQNTSFSDYGGSVLLMRYSDDDGRSWHSSSRKLTLPYTQQVGLQEPGIYEKSDGTLWGYSRTTQFCQFSFYSMDDGITWSLPHPDVRFSSPEAPMTIRALPDGRVAAIFNPIPNYIGRREADPFGSSNWGRTPFVIRVSTDGGETFGSMQFLEDNPHRGYCYPAFFPLKDAVLVAYCGSDTDGKIPLSATIIRRINCEALK